MRRSTTRPTRSSYRSRAPWTDKNLDNIAQGNPGLRFATDQTCEINFATVPTNFGVVSLSSPDPNVTRPYGDSYNVGITREVLRGVSLSFDWYRGYGKNLLDATTRCGQALQRGWHGDELQLPAVTIFSPIDGHAITMYDTVSVAAQAVANVDTNDSNLTQRYDALESNFSGACPRADESSAARRRTNNRQHVQLGRDELEPANYCDQTQSGLP